MSPRLSCARPCPVDYRNCPWTAPTPSPCRPHEGAKPGATIAGYLRDRCRVYSSECAKDRSTRPRARGLSREWNAGCHCAIADVSAFVVFQHFLCVAVGAHHHLLLTQMVVHAHHPASGVCRADTRVAGAVNVFTDYEHTSWRVHCRLSSLAPSGRRVLVVAVCVHID
eukprot:m.1211813 g.1211813  ORF g.1211813 m.1211813 type:complete len:168 (-) comp24596_c0_seq1:191-694(-)